MKKKSPNQPGTRSGVISAAYGAYYGVRPDHDPLSELMGKLRGRMRIKRGPAADDKMRHSVIVGDLVTFTVDQEDANLAHIEAVAPRRNLLCRASSQTYHGLGANLDRAVLIAGLAEPTTPLRLVDRFLVSCHAGGVEPILVWSKLDLVGSVGPGDGPQEYSALGYRTFTLDLIRSQPDEQFVQLQQLLATGVSLLAGNSGTGKSTLLNALFDQALQKTGEISSANKKGRHTTTNPKLLITKAGARVIDTPGVKEWGILHLDQEDIFQGMPELETLAELCEFPGCQHHASDPSCALQAALRTAREELPGAVLTPDRLDSLDAMLESLQHPDRIRYGDYVKPTGRMRNREP